SQETREQPATVKKTKGKTKKARNTTETVRILHVVQDRFRLGNAEPQRVMEALDAAFAQGRGHIAVYVMDTPGEPVWRFSNHLHCAQCDVAYSTPLPSTFSFNSPLGACETCRGFGRVMGIDYDLVIPDPTK